MIDVTHAAGDWPCHHQCGAPMITAPVDNPTCLLCIAGVRFTIADIITANSVKDIQEMEDQKFLDEVNTIIESNKRGT